MELDQPFKYLGKVSCIKSFPEIDLEHWKENTSRQDTFEQHKYTETIFLRFRKLKDVDEFHDWEIVNYPLMSVYGDAIFKYKEYLAEKYTFSDFCVLIANLLPYGSIASHYDTGPYFEKSHRIHIPIKTNAQVKFTIGYNSPFTMKEGCAYEIDNVGSCHGVVNYGNEDRYHLIFDLFV